MSHRSLSDDDDNVISTDSNSDISVVSDVWILVWIVGEPRHRKQLLPAKLHIVLMSVYVRMCVCIYVCTYVCTYVHTYVCMYVCVKYQWRGLCVPFA